MNLTPKEQLTISYLVTIGFKISDISDEMVISQHYIKKYLASAPHTILTIFSLVKEQHRYGRYNHDDMLLEMSAKNKNITLRDYHQATVLANMNQYCILLNTQTAYEVNQSIDAIQDQEYKNKRSISSAKSKAKSTHQHLLKELTRLQTLKDDLNGLVPEARVRLRDQKKIRPAKIQLLRDLTQAVSEYEWEYESVLSSIKTTNKRIKTQISIIKSSAQGRTKMTKKANRLSDLDKQELTYLYTRRIPMTHIAKYLGVTMPAVRNFVLINRLDQLSIEAILVEAEEFYIELTNIDPTKLTQTKTTTTQLSSPLSIPKTTSINKSKKALYPTTPTQELEVA